jgi:hypothetical protein
MWVIDIAASLLASLQEPRLDARLFVTPTGMYLSQDLPSPSHTHRHDSPLPKPFKVVEVQHRHRSPNHSMQ